MGGQLNLGIVDSVPLREFNVCATVKVRGHTLNVTGKLEAPSPLTAAGYLKAIIDDAYFMDVEVNMVTEVKDAS